MLLCTERCYTFVEPAATVVCNWCTVDLPFNCQQLVVLDLSLIIMLLLSYYFVNLMKTDVL